MNKRIIFPAPLHYGRKERSDGIASQQVRLGRASMTISSQVCKYICGHLDRSGEVS